jgi:tetratricopeptide (TPR) repeat protein
LERSGGDRGGSKRWKLQAGRAAGGFAGALALASCLAGTRAQCRFWQNTETLFRHAAAVTGANEIARDMLGTVLSNQGKFEEAIRQYREALKLYPNYAKFPHILYCHLGRVYTLQGRVDEAIEALTQAVRLKPNYAAAHFNLGLALEAKGKPEKSADELKAAAALAPDDAVVQARLVDALIKAGKADEALRHCQALRQARPGDPAPCFTLARVCVALNRSEEAVVSLKEAIRLAPKAAVYCNQLAWIYATHPKAQLRNGAEAVRLAERACALTRRREAGFLDTLSAAYAEAGRFAEAIKTAQEERAVGLAAKDNEAVEAAAQKLELYQAGKPYRER